MQQPSSTAVSKSGVPSPPKIDALHIDLDIRATGKGADAFDRRPKLAAALAEARQHGKHCPVAVAKLDRLSRDVHFVSGLMTHRVLRHGAGILASEETIYYAFHPLAGRTVASNGRRVVFGGDVHLTIRLPDGTLTLTPEWMLRPAAAGCEIRSAPRLCLARLRDLRA